MTRLGVLYGVGAGPGAPDLLTLRALSVLRSADVLALPRSSDFGESVAWQIVRGHCGNRDGQIRLKLTFPMSKDAATVARIRLLIVDPKARGLGLGARLVDECVRFARDAGYKKITLWTHSVLTAARHIYQKAGFTLSSREERVSFSKPVVSEYWDLVL